MRDKRIISVCDYRLVRIRNQFRMLWLAFYKSLWNSVFDEMESLRYSKDDRRLTVDEMDPKELGKYNSLLESKYSLQDQVGVSICKCRNCGRSDLDMYFNKKINSWFCVRCLQDFKNKIAKNRRKKSDEDRFLETFR